MFRLLFLPRGAHALARAPPATARLLFDGSAGARRRRAFRTITPHGRTPQTPGKKMQTLTRTVLLFAVLSAGTAHAQSTQPSGYKDPGTAMIISVLIPGGGQIYSGETQRGLTLLGIGLGGLVVGTAISASSTADGDTNFAPLALGYLAYLGSWAYGIVDADDSAERMNSKRGLAIGGAQVMPVLAIAPTGGTGVGINIRF